MKTKIILLLHYLPGFEHYFGLKNSCILNVRLGGKPEEKGIAMPLIGKAKRQKLLHIIGDFIQRFKDSITSKIKIDLIDLLRTLG